MTRALHDQDIFAKMVHLMSMTGVVKYLFHIQKTHKASVVAFSLSRETNLKVLIALTINSGLLEEKDIFGQ